MASKKKEHKNDLRNLVLQHYQNGDSQREIAAKTLLPRTTVQYMIEKYKSIKRVGNLFGRARRRKTTATTDRLIQRKVKLDRRKSASAVKVEIKNELGISLHVGTIRNQAHEARLFGRVARKKPYVNKINRGKRLKFAKEMLEKLSSFWESVIWFDEWKFNLFGSDGKVMVWRTPCEEFDSKCKVLTVKHSGSSVMVWGCFIRRGIGKLCVLDRIMDRFYYRDILEQNLLPSIDHFKFGQQYHFMHDNDPKHTCEQVKDWLKQKTIQTLPWPSFSPDLNPIENLWDEFERRIKRHQPKNLEELELQLTQEWSNIELSVLEKLIDSVASRLYECVKTKGYPARY